VDIGLLTHFVSSFQSVFLSFVFVYGGLIKIDFINFYVFRRRLSPSFGYLHGPPVGHTRIIAH